MRDMNGGPRGRRVFLTAVAAGALLIAGAARADSAPSDMMSGRPDMMADMQTMMFSQAHLVRSLLPSVVNITARAQVLRPTSEMNASNASQESEPQYKTRVSAGSGFVIDPSGVIVTNWHVVDAAYDITVTFFDGERAKAEVINAARLVDIALLKVSVGHKLHAVTWGDSTRTQIGDPVLAIGNPLGVGLSVTAGIVSALNRNLMDTPYDDFIQTDAPINHGNSGGPLFNLKGRVIGINTALISPTTGSAGLGFAIPSRDAHFVIERLLHFGWVRPAWLGVKIQEVTQEMANALGMPAPAGSIVAWVVAGGPAAKGGLQIGDIITKFGPTVPTDDRDLLRLIASSAPGEHIALTVLREGKPVQVSVTLDEWPKMQWEERDAPVKVRAPHWVVPPDLGIAVTPVTDAMFAKGEFPPSAKDIGAVKVTAIRHNAEASRHGLAAGDLILRVDNKEIGTAAQLRQAIDHARSEHRRFANFLVLPANWADKNSKFPGPRWIALQVSE